MLILDTNIFRGVKGAYIDLMLKPEFGYTVGVPTLAILEIASHLEDDDKEPVEVNFMKRRAELLKTLKLEVLDDPYVAFAKATKREFNPSRAADAPALKAFVQFLQQAETLAEYQKFRLELDTGEAGDVPNFAVRAKQALDEFETENKSVFLEFQQRVNETLNGDKPVVTEKIFMDLMRGLVSKGSREQRADDLSALMYYGGYQIHRVFEYIKSGKGFDVNDAEDLAMCLHLNTMTDDIIVTGDKGTRAVVDATTQLLNRYAFQLSEEFGANLIPAKCWSKEDLLVRLGVVTHA